MRRPTTPTLLASVAVVLAATAAAPQAEALAERVGLANNALHLQGRTLAEVRANINAKKLGGRTLTQVRSNVDAAKLAGAPASDYARGNARVYAARLSLDADTGNATILEAPGAFTFEMSCSSAGSLRIFVRNVSGEDGQLGVSDPVQTSLNRTTGTNSGLYLTFDKPSTVGTATLGTSKLVATGHLAAGFVTGKGCQADAQITVSRLP